MEFLSDENIVSHGRFIFKPGRYCNNVAVGSMAALWTVASPPPSTVQPRSADANDNPADIAVTSTAPLV